MAILKLTPSCKDYLWGGSRLRTDFGIKSDLEPLAEAWVLSCHPDGPSYLPDGTTLADYAAARGQEVRGNHAQAGALYAAFERGLAEACGGGEPSYAAWRSL